MANRLAQLAISPTGFVFDPGTGATYTVNATGRVVLEAIRDGAGLSEVTEQLRGAFDVGEHDLARDALEYVRLLREQGLLEPGFQLA